MECMSEQVVVIGVARNTSNFGAEMSLKVRWRNLNGRYVFVLLIYGGLFNASVSRSD